MCASNRSMNYSIQSVVPCGNRKVYLDITVNGTHYGRLVIKLFGDVFPAGVENFVHLVMGDTQSPDNKNRSYTGCKAFRFLHNRYLMFGDIYTNNGKSAGTIYNDQPIPALFGDYYIPCNARGLIALVPFIDENAGPQYDSTFMITLAQPRLSNSRLELDKDQVVIGQVCDGLNILHKINNLITPYAGRKYPEIVISRCGMYR